MSKLKDLPNISVISPLVTRILGLNPGHFTLQGTNTYLIGSGKSRILLDTGDGRIEYAQLLRQYLDMTGIEISTILISHWHPDHVLGIHNMHLVQKNMPTVYKGIHGTNSDINVAWEPLHDGQQFQIDETTLTAYYTPGHASDHFVFWLDQENCLFTADNVLGEGTAVFEDLSVYLKSLRRMNEIGMTRKSPQQQSYRMYPAHGEIVEDGNIKIIQYIGHREQREKELLQVLGEHDEPVHIDVLTKILYKDLPEKKFWAAKNGVALHLDKLVKDKLVQSNDDHEWILIEKSELLSPSKL